MNSPSPDADRADLTLLKEAALSCGPLLRRTSGSAVRSWSKGEFGPVTEIDIEVDTALRSALLRARPDYGWLSEESADDPARLTHRRVFIVDPIDGTRAFMEGVPEYCVALAVVDGGHAVAALIYNPATEEIFEAQAGGGALLNGTPTRVSPTRTLEHARMIGRPAFFKSPRWVRPWPPVSAEHKIAISYRMALVATGAYDGTIALGFKHEWDVAAGALIVCEAGGMVTDPWGGRLVFNQADPRAPGLVAAGPGLHPLLIERVSALAHPGVGLRTQTKE